MLEIKNELERNVAADQLRSICAASIPYYEKNDRKKYIEQLQELCMTPWERRKEEEYWNNIVKHKRMREKLKAKESGSGE